MHFITIDFLMCIGRSTPYCSVFVFNPCEGIHRCRTGTVVCVAGGAKRAVLLHGDAIGITAWIKEPGVAHVLVNNSATVGVSKRDLHSMRRSITVRGQGEG